MLCLTFLQQMAAQVSTRQFAGWPHTNQRRPLPIRPSRPGAMGDVISQHGQGVKAPKQAVVHGQCGHTKNPRGNRLLRVRLQAVLDYLTRDIPFGRELLEQS